MNPHGFKSDFILFIVAAIWGAAFVAQRMGMDHVGPFTYNTFRFALGSLSLIPVLGFITPGANRASDFSDLIRAGTVSGLFLFAGITLQQFGLVYTTAGKAGFITGLYVVIVPVLGRVFIRKKTSVNTWTGALLAAAGLFLLSVKKGFTIESGDGLVLLCAICFAGHLIVIARLSKRFDTIRLTLVQCITCAVLSMVMMILFEPFVLKSLLKAVPAILYTGILSTGLAYSLQVYGQRNAHPSHAAIIFSLESVIAAFGGWMFLNELLTPKAIAGCALMLSGMIFSQIKINHP